MSNGNNALKILVHEAETYLAEEPHMDFSKCGVSPVMPKATLLILKIQAEKLKSELGHDEDKEGASIKAGLRGFEIKNIPPIDLIKIVGIISTVCLLGYLAWASVQDRIDKRKAAEVTAVDR
jgi:hypothetical protein